MSYVHALVVSIWLINIHVWIECPAKEWLLMSQSLVELQFITLPSKQHLAFNFDILSDSKYLTHPNQKYWHSFSISISWVLDIQLNTIPSLPIQTSKQSIKPIPSTTTVDCLLDEDTGEWIPETIHAFFDQETAAKILQVQVCRREGEDFARWPYDKHGCYTVRSAYNLARSESFYLTRGCRGRGLSSHHCEEGKSWKAIWKIQAPNKMKIHLQRFAHDCLPSGVQMIRRQIPTTDACVFSGREEDIEHASLTCQFAQEVWRLVKCFFGIQLHKREFVSPKAWLFDFLKSATD
jgi:hypothetical protein